MTMILWIIAVLLVVSGVFALCASKCCEELC